MGGTFKRRQWAARALDSVNEKKTTVVTATGTAGAMYKQGTAKDTANFDRTHEAMVEYVGFLPGPKRNQDEAREEVPPGGGGCRGTSSSDGCITQTQP